MLAVAGADKVEKQPHIRCTEEAAGGVKGAMWARLSEMITAGHLVGAAYKPKYAGSGGVTDVEAMPTKGELKRCLVYPILAMTEVEGQVGARERRPAGRRLPAL